MVHIINSRIVPKETHFYVLQREASTIRFEPVPESEGGSAIGPFLPPGREGRRIGEHRAEAEGDRRRRRMRNLRKKIDLPLRAGAAHTEWKIYLIFYLTLLLFPCCISISILFIFALIPYLTSSSIVAFSLFSTFLSEFRFFLI
jgi:hypothetical protein